MIAVLDGFGVHGAFLNFGLILALFFSALLIFVYLWRRGKLDMDEEPKIQMMKHLEDDESNRK